VEHQPVKGIIHEKQPSNRRTTEVHLIYLQPLTIQAMNGTICFLLDQDKDKEETSDSQQQSTLLLTLSKVVHQLVGGSVAAPFSCSNCLSCS
jgi:hypothetical protein